MTNESDNKPPQIIIYEFFFKLHCYHYFFLILNYYHVISIFGEHWNQEKSIICHTRFLEIKKMQVPISWPCFYLIK
jgi:hypothetical protein